MNRRAQMGHADGARLTRDFVVERSGDAEHTDFIRGETCVALKPEALYLGTEAMGVGVPLGFGESGIADPVDVEATAGEDESSWERELGVFCELLDGVDGFGLRAIAFVLLYVYVDSDAL